MESRDKNSLIKHGNFGKILFGFSRSVEDSPVTIHVFIWGFTSLSMLYRSYHDGWFCGQREPVYIVGQGSVL